MQEIPVLELESAGPCAYHAFFGREHYPVFIRGDLECFVEGRPQTDPDDGSVSLHVLLNPDVLPDRISERFWEPAIVHEIYEVKGRMSHEAGDEGEAEYCMQHFSPAERAEYLALVECLLGPEHDKVAFLRDRFRR